MYNANHPAKGPPASNNRGPYSEPSAASWPPPRRALPERASVPKSSDDLPDNFNPDIPKAPARATPSLPPRVSPPRMSPPPLAGPPPPAKPRPPEPTAQERSEGHPDVPAVRTLAERIAGEGDDDDNVEFHLKPGEELYSYVGPHNRLIMEPKHRAWNSEQVDRIAQLTMRPIKNIISPPPRTVEAAEASDVGYGMLFRNDKEYFFPSYDAEKAMDHTTMEFLCKTIEQLPLRSSPYDFRMEWQYLSGTKKKGKDTLTWTSYSVTDQIFMYIATTSPINVNTPPPMKCELDGGEHDSHRTPGTKVPWIYYVDMVRYTQSNSETNNVRPIRYSEVGTAGEMPKWKDDPARWRGYHKGSGNDDNDDNDPSSRGGPKTGSAQSSHSAGSGSGQPSASSGTPWTEASLNASNQGGPTSSIDWTQPTITTHEDCVFKLNPKDGKHYLKDKPKWASTLNTSFALEDVHAYMRGASKTPGNKKDPFHCVEFNNTLDLMASVKLYSSQSKCAFHFPGEGFQYEGCFALGLSRLPPGLMQYLPTGKPWPKHLREDNWNVVTLYHGSDLKGSLMILEGGFGHTEGAGGENLQSLWGIPVDGCYQTTLLQTAVSYPDLDQCSTDLDYRGPDTHLAKRGTSGAYYTDRTGTSPKKFIVVSRALVSDRLWKRDQGNMLWKAGAVFPIGILFIGAHPLYGNIYQRRVHPITFEVPAEDRLKWITFASGRSSVLESDDTASVVDMWDSKEGRVDRNTLFVTTFVPHQWIDPSKDIKRPSVTWNPDFTLNGTWRDWAENTNRRIYGGEVSSDAILGSDPNAWEKLNLKGNADDLDLARRWLKDNDLSTVSWTLHEYAGKVEGFLEKSRPDQLAFNNKTVALSIHDLRWEGKNPSALDVILQRQIRGEQSAAASGSGSAASQSAEPVASLNASSEAVSASSAKSDTEAASGNDSESGPASKKRKTNKKKKKNYALDTDEGRQQLDHQMTRKRCRQGTRLLRVAVGTWKQCPVDIGPAFVGTLDIPTGSIIWPKTPIPEPTMGSAEAVLSLTVVPNIPVALHERRANEAGRIFRLAQRGEAPVSDLTEDCDLRELSTTWTKDKFYLGHCWTCGHDIGVAEYQCCDLCPAYHKENGETTKYPRFEFDGGRHTADCPVRNVARSLAQVAAAERKERHEAFLESKKTAPEPETYDWRLKPQTEPQGPPSTATLVENKIELKEADYSIWTRGGRMLQYLKQWKSQFRPHLKMDKKRTLNLSINDTSNEFLRRNLLTSTAQASFRTGRTGVTERVSVEESLVERDSFGARMLANCTVQGSKRARVGNTGTASNRVSNRVSSVSSQFATGMAGPQANEALDEIVEMSANADKQPIVATLVQWDRHSVQWRSHDEIQEMKDDRDLSAPVTFEQGDLTSGKVLPLGMSDADGNPIVPSSDEEVDNIGDPAEFNPGAALMRWAEQTLRREPQTVAAAPLSQEEAEEFRVDAERYKAAGYQLTLDSAGNRNWRAINLDDGSIGFHVYTEDPLLPDPVDVDLPTGFDPVNFNRAMSLADTESTMATEADRPPTDNWSVATNADTDAAESVVTVPYILS